LTWLQFALLIGFNAACIEWGLTRRQSEIRRLLQVRGSTDAALEALSGRVDQVQTSLKGMGDRLEFVERELKLR
jgi:hypothetical protein